ncbi:MAG: phosphotransferase [Aestuariivita sp.]|nr:phosphotransferase [Aestuariivita sp.]
MDNRTATKEQFLNRIGWARALRYTLVGDASNRRYERLRKEETGECAILMDAPPDKERNVKHFTFAAQHLLALGLSAPQIFAEDCEQGFLLLEDLGNDLFSKFLQQQPAMQSQLYKAAADALIVLHNTPPPELLVYDPELMVNLAALAFTEYRVAICGNCSTSIVDKFKMGFKPFLEEYTSGQEVMILRDYHAENLLWLPKREGVARVGMLDFQDAMRGHPAYDLVSLLQDARRNVPQYIEKETIDSYILETSIGDDFRQAYILLGIQRNLRILGIFARLSTHYFKQQYVNMIPRVWSYLLRDLENSELADFSSFILSELPEPHSQALQRLRKE